MKHIVIAAVVGLTCLHCSGASIEARSSPLRQDTNPEPEFESGECDGPLSETNDPGEALERLWLTETICEEWLTEPMRRFLQTPLIDMRQGMIEQLGSFRNVSAREGGLWANFERGRVAFEVYLDAEGRLAGIWNRIPELTFTDLDELLPLYQELPGEVSVLVQTDGEPRAALSAETPMAVGSAFKLSVLAALVDAIEAGEGDWSAGWDRVVELQQEWRSLPSGQLQDWPIGSPITIHSLATLMISQSDNTATDALMTLLGSRAVEEHSGSLRPVPTTRQMFHLHAADVAVQQRYLHGDEPTRRAILEELSEAPLPSIAAIERAGAHPELGYRYSAKQLCVLLEEVSDQRIMSVNPGPVDPARWERVVYKGGSSRGVINLSSLVRDSSGHEHCVIATWNHGQPVDEERFITLYLSLMPFVEQ